jgi:uncharacterized glyoxalase superfamily protein PhnB
MLGDPAFPMSDFYTTPLTPELCCTDFHQSLAFYTQVLDFKIQYQRPEEGFAMLERQGARLMLDQIYGVDGKGRSWLTGVLEKPFGRGINLQIETTDVEALYAKVQAVGAVIFLPIEEKWYGKGEAFLGNRQFIVQDPDGYLLRFFESLGEKALSGSI